MLRHALTGITLAVLAASPITSVATPLDRLPKKNFVYDAKQIALVDLLRDFAGGIGIPVVIAEGVTGTVNANFSLTPRAFLDLISRSFGLIWYFDGTVLHVYPSSQIQSRLFRLMGPAAADMPRRLSAFGILDPRYPVSVMPGSGGSLVFASGPPRHIELLEAIIDVSSIVEPENTSQQTLRSFTLTHASAVDREVQGTKVPGIATTLSGIFSKAAAPKDQALPGMQAMMAKSAEINGQMTAATEAAYGRPEDRARKLSEARNEITALTRPSSTAANGGATKSSMTIQIVRPPAEPPAVAAEPTFTADESSNTVIVRAMPKQMDEIAELIKRLDVPSHMVEVEATIIDVSSDEVRSLGFDWRFDSNSALNQVQLSPAVPTSTTSGAIPQGTGYNITTLLAAGGRELLARIRALEARGTARVVSQPKVLGAANRTAVLSDKRTASVRVAGNQDARLYSVETGTTLRVTPRVTGEGTTARIILELLIEDGGFSTEAVDEVPVALKTSISTIATLNEGQALLVGGIEVEGSSGGRSGIPYLSKLPVIGGAFKFDSAQSSRRQRLFLITPKRVDLGNLSRQASRLPSPDNLASATPSLPPLQILRDRYGRQDHGIPTGCKSTVLPSGEEC